MKHIRKHLLLFTIVFLLITFGILILIKKDLLDKSKKINNIKTEELKIEEKAQEEKEEIINKVYVDIKGAVTKPGVYEIEEDKKVIDVINLAGGFTESADTSMINLAKKVKNEMVVIIYTKEEVKKATEPNQIIKYIDKECICPNIKNDACINNNSSNTKKEVGSSNKNENNNEEKIVNINTATLEELQTLSGIGESKAKAIIEYREENGEFKSIEEIKQISGIGESLYEKIKDHITI